jgi:predicted nucleic acid-binding protein
MTSPIAIDSSVLVASVIEETHTAQADALLSWVKAQSFIIAAPPLLRYEVVATLRKLTHRGQIDVPDGLRLIRAALNTPVQWMLDEAVLERAYLLAAEHGLPTAYDAQYLAVAERLSCDLWTFDKRLFNSVHNRLHWVRDAAQFSPPSV